MFGIKNLNNFGGIIITDIKDNWIKYYYDFGGENVSEIFTEQIRYNEDGEPYFETKEGKQFINEFIKA